MKLKRVLKPLIVPIAIVCGAGLGITVNADPLGAKAISYFSVDNVQLFTDVNSDGVPDPDSEDFIDAVPETFVLETAASASLNGVASAGGGILLDVEPACVSGGTPAGGGIPDAPPCPVGPDIPGGNFFTEVPGFDANKISRSDAETTVPGATTGGSATSHAEIQINEVGDCTIGGCQPSSSSENTFTVTVTDPATLILSFLYDYCREGLLTAGAAAGSIARPSSEVNFSVEEQLPDGTLITRFNVGGAATDPASLIDELEGSFQVNGPGPASNIQAPAPAGTACFTPGDERPPPSLQALIFTDPTPGDAALPDNCDETVGGVDQNLNCFQAQPGGVYNVLIDENTEATARLTPGGDGVHKWYFGKQASIRPEGEPLMQPAGVVTLNDQFASRDVSVRFIRGLWNPAGKNELVDPARDDHHTCYEIATLPGQGLQIFDVDIETNNFGEDSFTLGLPKQLCISAAKTFNGVTEGSPVGTDYLCYTASSGAGGEFTLNDQFDDEVVNVTRLSRFCTPVGKNQPAPPTDPAEFDHLACYDFNEPVLDPFITVGVDDQFTIAQGFDPLTFWAEKPERFCEPARKIAVTPRF